LTVRQPSRVARAAKGRQEREDAEGQGSREWLLPMERSVQTFVKTVRPRCLFRRIRQLTADQEVRPVVQECLEAAISRADHLDPIRFFKSLLLFGGGRGALARGRDRLARAVARRGPTLGRRRGWGPVAIVRRGLVRRVKVVVV